MRYASFLCGLILAISAVTARATELVDFVRELTRGDRALVVLPEAADLQDARSLVETGHVVVVLTHDDRLQTLRRQAGDALGKNLFVKRGDVGHIPLADNYANAILVPSHIKLDKIRLAEIVRALAPFGIAAIEASEDSSLQNVQALLPSADGLSVTADGDWIILRKNLSKGSDSWSYWNHSPNNNPVSREQNVVWPLQTQWLGKPFFVTRHTFALVDGGIYFTGKRAEWDNPGNYLEARDAYNGLRLWRKELPDEVNLMLPTWIATGGKLYGTLRNEVFELEGATGRELSRLAIGADGQQIKWLVKNGNVYFALLGFADVQRYTPETDRREQGDYLPISDVLVALDAGTEKELWRLEDQRIDARAIGMLGGRIYYYARGRHLRSVDARSGEVVWSNDDPSLMSAMVSPLDPGGRIDGVTLYRCGLLCTPEVIVLNLQARADRAGFDAATGKLLWQNKLFAGNAGRGGAMLAFGGNLHAKGMRPSPINLRTGEASSDLPYRIGGGCGRDTATATALIGFLGEYVTPEGEQLSGTNIAKPECHLGSFAAAGLLFNPQGSCGCSLPQIGLLTQTSGTGLDLDEFSANGQRLTTYATARTGPTSGQGKWFTGGGSNNRDGFAPVRLGTQPRKVTWAAPGDAQPAAPISVNDRTFVADHAGHVRAIGPSGDVLWQFTAGGAFHAAPTWFEGRLYAGCADGYVYCLDATAGKLLWTFQAAPLPRDIMVYGQLSSTWPVNSGVLIHQRTAYFIAGLINRDGTLAYALDATTGAVKWCNPRLGWIDNDRRDGFDCKGGLTIFDGKLCFNSSFGGRAALDLETGEPIPLPVETRFKPGKDITTGIGNVNGKLLVRGGNRMFFDPDTRLARGTRFCFALPDGNAASMFTVAAYETARQMPVWDTKTLFVSRDERFVKTLQAWDIATTQQWVGTLIAPKVDSVRQQFRFIIDTRQMSQHAQPEPRWSKDMEVVGLAVGQDALIAISLTFEDPRFRRGEASWTLHALTKESGEELWSVALPGQPASDPLAICADGTIVVALLDGTVVGIGR